MKAYLQLWRAQQRRSCHHHAPEHRAHEPEDHLVRPEQHHQCILAPEQREEIRLAPRAEEAQQNVHRLLCHHRLRAAGALRAVTAATVAVTVEVNAEE